MANKNQDSPGDANAPPDPPVVRPKSSHRKGRSAQIQREQREPSQDRSRKRHEDILLAAESLLEVANIEDLSLSDIATKAGISKASVHYHFPTIAAIQLALGYRYDQALSELLADYHVKLTKMRVPTWQEWIRIEATAVRDYFNAHRPVCEAILGPLLHRENRLAMLSQNTQIGLSKLRNLCQIFEVPNPEILEKIIAYNGEILDVFWSGSYLKNGYIDDHVLEESIRASVGYLRNFLPEVMPMKAEFAAQE